MYVLVREKIASPARQYPTHISPTDPYGLRQQQHYRYDHVQAPDPNPNMCGLLQQPSEYEEGAGPSSTGVQHFHPIAIATDYSMASRGE